MRSLAHARAKGREYRELIGPGPNGLTQRLEQFLWREFGIRTQAVNPALIRHSRGEVSPGGRVLKYSDTLSPAERREAFAHELAHLVLHERLTEDDTPYDPILGSAYTDEGPGAIARYSQRAYEEAQAQAFATELLCPSEAVFDRWRRDPIATASSLADHYGVSIAVVYAQLAHALHELAVGTPEEEAGGQHRPTVESDPSQLVAARFRGRPALVDAGPGTGKTATLIRRVQFAIEECGAHPRQILVLTYSNEAARELQHRVAARFGEDIADKITVATFHGFGMSFLHAHGHVLGLGADFTLIDDDGVRELLTSILGRVPCERLLNLRAIEESVEAIAKHIGHCKDGLRDPGALADAINSWQPDPSDAGAVEAKLGAKELFALYSEYESAKWAARRVDFADLIMLPVRVLDRRPDIAAAYHEKFPWVLVDEFQDVSRATSRLLRNLCSAENPPWVVGDARQSIYRFRGAAPENVREFTTDFPDAERFELVMNYRSCKPIVQAANSLAALMKIESAGSEESGGEDALQRPVARDRWKAAGDLPAIGEAPVRLAMASSDYAEREGIADQVKTWLAENQLAPGEVAVLARRNLDVREIVLALARRGIRASACGLLTPEGAAGDLAAVMSVSDSPTASLPRIAFALARGRHDTAVINSAVAQLMTHAKPGAQASNASTIRSAGSHDAPQLTPLADEKLAPEAFEIATEVTKVCAVLERESFRADGFATLCGFLFDASNYLRRILESPESSERAMALVESVSALSLAASYRLTHPDAPSITVARIGCAERLRARLTEATPLPVPPPLRRDAVRVMTCHASKGLEFPCVIVAGQTIPARREEYSWLPPDWRPTHYEELEQADALLFVGVTRAKQAVVVSYPGSAGGGQQSPAKKVVPLFERWRVEHDLDCLSWEGVTPPAPEIRAGPIWGGAIPSILSLSTLDSSSCSLQTYVEGFLGARFASVSRPLYPAFVAITRRAMRRVVAVAAELGRAIDPGEADAILDEAWPVAEFASHPHAGIYRAAAQRMVRGFASAFSTSLAQRRGPIAVLDPELRIDGSEPPPSVRLDLVAHLLYSDGRVEAISFRPEAITTSKDGSVNWSTLNARKRLAFVLLERATPGITPRVYSGADGALRDFKRSQRGDSVRNDTVRAIEQLDALGRAEFSTTVKPFTCDRCATRVGCPYWMGAIV